MSRFGLHLFIILIFEVFEVLNIIDIYVFNILVFTLICQFFSKARHVFVTVYKTVLSRQGSELVALGIELIPQHILQLFQAKTCHSRDKHHRQILRQGFFQHLNEFIVEQVTLGDS